MPSTTSVGADLGLANCPAIRPTLTTGTLAPYVNTIAICSMTLNVSRIKSALNCSKLSAQSPPCSRNASPRDAAPRAAFRRLASPANTNGGYCPSWPPQTAERPHPYTPAFALWVYSASYSFASQSSVFSALGRYSHELITVSV